MSAVDDVVRAWLVAGPRPDVHARAKAKLRAEWPMLAEALERLASEVTGSPPTTPERA